MDENKQIEIQTKLASLVKERQVQISEIKNFYDSRNKSLYKEVILLSDNLCLFEEMMNKSEYRMKVENLYSLSLSLGKVLDLNNSIKTVLLGVKIFEEHESCLKQNAPNLSNQNTKSFIYKFFEKNDSIPLIKNELIKNKFLTNQNNEDLSYVTSRDFYQALYRNDGNFWADFHKYLNFQMDLKQRNKDNQFKLDDFTAKLYKLYQGSTVNYFKFYTRCHPSIDLDYSDLVVSACDIFFMIYNKFMDKICYQPSLLEYITKLDNFIWKYFIDLLSDDLQKLSEFIAKREMDDLMKNLDKIYN